jgi:hypothetical protein
MHDKVAVNINSISSTLARLNSEVRENGGQDGGISPTQSEGTPYGSPELHLPDDSVVNTTFDSEQNSSHENIG